MLSCKQATDSLSAQMDGELSLVASLKLRFHQFRCGDCRAVAANMRSMVASLRDRLPVARGSNNATTNEFADRIMAQLSVDDAASAPDASPEPPQT